MNQGDMIECVKYPSYGNGLAVFKKYFTVGRVYRIQCAGEDLTEVIDDTNSPHWLEKSWLECFEAQHSKIEIKTSMHGGSFEVYIGEKHQFRHEGLSGIDHQSVKEFAQKIYDLGRSHNDN